MPATFVPLRMRLLGGNADAPLAGEGTRPARSYYYRGAGASLWCDGVPHHARVRCRGIYPGIDVSYYGNSGELEFDFVIAPGADPNAIELQFDGVSSMRIVAGELHLQTSAGAVIQRSPVAYQEVGGRRQRIPSAYVLDEDARSVGFRLGAYDRGRPLVIDPVIAFSTYYGGKVNEGFSGGVRVDALGNIIVAGWTSSPDFRTVNAAQPRWAGFLDVVVVKLSPGGKSIVYSTFLGGVKKWPETFRGYDYAHGLAVDAAGNAYVTGRTSSRDFPTTVGAFDRKCGPSGNCGAGKGFFDAFVTKLSPAGKLVYSTYLGGSRSDLASDIAVDAKGSAYVTGWTDSSDFPTASPYQGKKLGASNCFLTKLRPDGTGLVYSTSLAGPQVGRVVSYNVGIGVAVDAKGCAHVGGYTSSSAFPTTSGAYQTRYAGGAKDAFLTKFAPSGQTLVFSTFLGGARSGFYGDVITGVAIDTQGRVWVTGQSDATDFPTVNPIRSQPAGGEDLFLSRFSPDGRKLQYSTFLGGTKRDRVNRMALDPAGSVYLTGYTLSPDFPTVNAIQTKYSGPRSTTGFLTKVAGDGKRLIYSTYLGGGSVGEGVDADPSGTAYLAGGLSGLIPLKNPLEPTREGVTDGFIARIVAASLTVTGTCPGHLSITGQGFAPGSLVVVAWSPTAGALTLPPGLCGGLRIGLQPPVPLFVALPDASGRVQFAATAPAVACGTYLQMIDIIDCGVSELAKIR